MAILTGHTPGWSFLDDATKTRRLGEVDDYFATA
jgi:hypothetical protein